MNGNMGIQKECVCCGSGRLNNVWELPGLPLTGIYVPGASEYDFENFHDEALQFCLECTHMQLSNPVDPALLYLETYTHRTSVSPISSVGNEFLERQIRRFTEEKKPRQILEIGCNDGLLLSKIRDVAENLAGFDPVLPDDLETVGNVSLIGGFGETVNYDSFLSEKIDFIISAHTFEHIVDPRTTLQRIQPFLAEHFDFVIEVPSSVSMVNQVRMDQVFPQHVNYYSPESLAQLMLPLGLHLAEIQHNYRYWGGTQILLFSNYRSSRAMPQRLDKGSVESSVSTFRGTMTAASTQLGHGDFSNRFALGAAQMLPIIAYHLGYETFQDKFAAIIDDNVSRQGMFFPDLRTPIVSSTDLDLEDSQIMITALDSSKPLLQKAIAFGSPNIVLPVGIA